VIPPPHHDPGRSGVERRRPPAYSDREAEIFDDAHIADPSSLHTRLRNTAPVSRIGESGVHLVATRELILEVLAREDDFSANLTGVLVRDREGFPSALPLPSSPATRVIATADEPDHRTHRAAVRHAFSPLAAARLEATVQTLARDAIAPWLAQGGGDFIPLAERLPAAVVGIFLGLPQSDLEHHRRWAMMGGDILAGVIDAAEMAELARESAAMHDYLAERFALESGENDRGGQTPLLSDLAAAVNRGELSREDALGIITVLFGAGGESTAALIGTAVRRLACDSALASELRRRPEELPAFVEEAIRLDPPFKFHYRSVRRPCRLAGYDLGEGDRLMLVWASANRDEAHFAEPDRLRLDRVHGRDHLGFGRGAHFCVGAHLARLEARVVCTELLSRTSHLEPVPGDPPTWAPSIFVRRLSRLPLRAEPAP
jgi:cytochrome P450